MADSISPRERLAMILAGERPDRFAVSIWRHFYHRESTVDGLVDAMVSFQKRFGWDFMKLNPRADYHVEDWGLTQEYSRDEFTSHRKTHFPIRSSADWERIAPLDPSRSPVLSDHLTAISRIRRGVGREVPILMTVFTPLSIAGRMVADSAILRRALDDEPDRVAKALRAITDTFVRFVQESRNAGADGIFLATTNWATRDMLTWEQYRELALPLDREFARATGSDATNLLHVCGSSCHVRELAKEEMNCALINWDSSDPTNPPIDSAETFLGNKIGVGGLDHRGWLRHGAPHEIGWQLGRLKEQIGSHRIIVAPGCTIPPETPMENLKAVQENV